MAAVMLSLGITLIGIKYLTEAHRKRIAYAEENNERWTREYHESFGRSVPWPYTKGIEKGARFLRACRTYLPIIGGVLFLVGLFVSSPQPVKTSGQSKGQQATESPVPSSPIAAPAKPTVAATPAKSNP
jgi:hypothetical protein